MAEFNVSTKLSMIDQVSRKMRLIGRQARFLAQRMDGVGKAGRAMGNAGKSGLFRITAPIALAGGFAAKTATDYQSAINRAGVLAGASEDQFKALNDQALMLGRTTQFSASEAAGGMGYLAQAGLKVNEIMEAMPATLNVAAAAQMDLAEAADLTTNVMGSNRMKVADLSRINDVMVKTMASSNTNIQELAQAMTYAGAPAAELKVEFEELSALMGILANNGIKADRAGTAILGMMTKLARPTAEADAALAAAGLAGKDFFEIAADGQKKMKPLAEVLDTLQAAGTRTGDTFGLLMQILGQRPAPALMAALGSGGDELRKLTEVLRQAGGTAERVAKKQMEGLPRAMKETGSAFEGMQLAFIRSGWDVKIMAVMDGLRDMMNAISDSNPDILFWGGAVAVAAAAIPPLLIGLGGLVLAYRALVIGSAILGLTKFAGLLKVVLLPVRMLTGALPLLGAAARLAGKGFRGMWLGLAAPIGVIIGLLANITDVMGVLGVSMDDLKGIVDRVWGGIVGFVRKGVALYLGYVQKMVAFLPDALNFGLPDKIAAVVRGLEQDGAGASGGQGAAPTQVLAAANGQQRVVTEVVIRGENLPRGMDVSAGKTQADDLSLNLGYSFAGAG